MGRTGWGPLGAMAVIGLGWGATQPLSKIAVSGGNQPLGILFWQFLVAVLVLGALLAARGGFPRITGARLRLWGIIALIGTLLPGSASYVAIGVLPSGIVSILLSAVPMLAYPIALSWGLERFSTRRFGGLALGLVGVLLITLPEASLPDPAMLAFVPLALVAPLFYALEGPFLAKWGTAGLGALEVLFGASAIGAALALPLALATGQWVDLSQPWGRPEWSILAASLIHACVYTGYVWLVGRAGAVFAVQVGYAVTCAGVLWAMLILGERFAATVWLALAVMLAGVALVQPRGRSAAGTPEVPPC